MLHLCTQTLATTEKPLKISGREVDATEHIRSIFYNPISRGYIYTETSSLQVLHELCRKNPFILLDPQIKIVQPIERPSLLKSPAYTAPVVGGFVRIIRGAYRGDTGMVLDISQHEDHRVIIAVIPRIDMFPTPPTDAVPAGSKADGRTQKKKQRPPQALFRAELVERIYPGEVKEQNDLNDVYVFRNAVYKEGFVVLDSPISALSDTEALPTIQELRIFTRTFKFEPLELVEHVNRFTCAEVELGEKVVVVGGEQEGLKGVVKEIKWDTIVVAAAIKETVKATSTNREVTREEEPWDVEVPSAMVERYFDVADAVIVLRGPEAGSRGFVTHFEKSGMMHVFTRDGFMRVSRTYISHANDV